MKKKKTYPENQFPRAEISFILKKVATLEF